MLWCAVFGATWSNYPTTADDMRSIGASQRWDAARLDASIRGADAAVEALHPGALLDEPR